MSLSSEVFKFIYQKREESTVFICPSCSLTAHYGECGKGLCNACGSLSHAQGQCNQPITLEEALSLFIAKSELKDADCSFQLMQLAFTWKRERNEYIALNVLEPDTIQILDGLL